MFKFQRSSERSILRSVVLALLGTLLVPVVTVLAPLAPASANGVTCDTVTTFTAADSNACWTKPYLNNGTLVTDLAGDQTPTDIDLVGDSGKPVYEYFSQGAGGFFFFKIRLKDAPRNQQNTQWSNGIWSVGLGSGSNLYGWVTLEGGNAQSLYIDTNTTFGAQTPSKSHTYTATSSDSGGAFHQADGAVFALYLKVPVNDLPSSATSGPVAVAAGTATGSPWNKDTIDSVMSGGVPNFSALQSTNLSISSTALPEIYLNRSTETGTAITRTEVKGTRIDTITVTNTGGAVDSYTVSPTLPNGLSINSSTGQISGTPTETKTSTVYTITANSANGNDTATYTLTIQDSAPAFSLLANGASCGSPCTDTVVLNNQLDTVTVVVGGSSGATDSYTVSPALPAGLTLDQTTGSITGVPTETRTQTTYTITAYGPGGSTNVSYVLTVSATALPANVVFTGGGDSSTVSVRIGASLPAYTLTNSGGHVDSYTVSPTPTSPLQFDSATGVISGSPTTLETNTVYTITAHSVGGNDTVTYTLTVLQQLAPSGGSPAPTMAFLTVRATGQGVVSPASNAYPIGTSVALSAAARTGWTFSNWTGACSGNTETCTVSMTNDKVIEAIFVEDVAASTAMSRFPIAVSVTGSGVVQVSPGQPAGGYLKGSVVRLTAAPRTGWSLDAWGGACSTSLEFCMITIDSAKSVTATFKATGAPATVSAAWVQPQGNGTSLVSWQSASGATQYLIDMNGKQVCRSTQTTCTIERIVGPRDIVVVRAANTAGTADASEAASYVTASRSLQLFSVNFAAGSSALTAKARAALNEGIRQMKLLGYTELSIVGHTDNREAKAAALSLARAKAVAAFVDRQLEVTVVTSGKAAMSPLTTNSTIAGRAANRRAVGFVR